MNIYAEKANTISSLANPVNFNGARFLYLQMFELQIINIKLDFKHKICRQMHEKSR